VVVVVMLTVVVEVVLSQALQVAGHSK